MLRLYSTFNDSSLGFVVVSSQPPPPFIMANMFGDHMVLQQAPARANIWGYVMKCDSTITATFEEKPYTATTFTGEGRREGIDNYVDIDSTGNSYIATKVKLDHIASGCYGYSTGSWCWLQWVCSTYSRILQLEV